jgi:hypothetical protein
LENDDAMGERMGQIGRMETDFFFVIPKESEFPVE